MFKLFSFFLKKQKNKHPEIARARGLGMGQNIMCVAVIASFRDLTWLTCAKFEEQFFLLFHVCIIKYFWTCLHLV